MTKRLLQLALFLGLMAPAAMTAQTARADVARARTIAPADPAMAQVRGVGHWRLIGPGDAALAQARVAARVASDSTGPKDYRMRGAVIGALALGIPTGVVIGGLCSMASESPDSNCTQVGAASGVLGGLIGAGIGAMIGRAIPRQRRVPASTVNR